MEKEMQQEPKDNETPVSGQNLVLEAAKETIRDNPNLLPLSIIVGALIVAGSVIYAARLISQKPPQQVTATQQAAGQNQQPPQQVTVPDRAGQPVLGDPNAPVTIVEFSDFQCPYCQKFNKETYGKIKSQYIDTGKVKFVYRYFPLSSHVNAEKSAEAAECANQQGKFYVYHDVLFANGQADGKGLDIASLKKYAKNLGLDTTKFNQCLDSGQTQQIVSSDLNTGITAGVEGTPTFFVNGKPVVGAQDISAFEQAMK